MGQDRVSIRNPPTLAPPVGYSHMAEVRGGKLAFIAGQVALDREGQVVGPGDYRKQAEQVFKNIGLALEAAGGSFKDLVKITVYLLDFAHAPEVREVRDRFVDTHRPPTSTAVQVSRLFRPEILLEIDAIASVE